MFDVWSFRVGVRVVVTNYRNKYAQIEWPCRVGVVGVMTVS